MPKRNINIYIDESTIDLADLYSDLLGISRGAVLTVALKLMDDYFTPSQLSLEAKTRAPIDNRKKENK